MLRIHEAPALVPEIIRIPAGSGLVPVILQHATCDGDRLPSPSMKGSSGMIEIGWNRKPRKDGSADLDFSVQEWFGKQKGLTLRATAKWFF